MKKNRKYSLILVAAVFALSMGVFFLHFTALTISIQGKR